MAVITGVPFRNSDTCEGVAFAVDEAPLDYAKIEITGRYPEGWAMNERSHEIVHVLRGAGSIAMTGTGVVPIAEGDVVHVPPQVWFSWEGDMTLGMACSPPFSPEQYTTIEADIDVEILFRVHQVVDRYFPEDKLFVEVEGFDAEDILNFVYGQLIEIGEDPDVIFEEFGITENGGNEDEV